MGKSPGAGEGGSQRNLLPFPAVWSPPPTFPGSPVPTNQSLSLGLAGVSFPACSTTPGPTPSLPNFAPGLPLLSWEELSEGCQPLSDLPSLYEQGEEAFVGRMVGACGAGAGRAPGHQQGGLVFPFLEKALEGDRRGEVLVPLITTAAGGLAGSPVDALRPLGEPSPVSTQTHVCRPSRARSHLQECFDFIEAGGQGSPGAVQT